MDVYGIVTEKINTLLEDGVVLEYGPYDSPAGSRARRAAQENYFRLLFELGPAQVCPSEGRTHPNEHIGI
jgi:hypothetical protein